MSTTIRTAAASALAIAALALPATSAARLAPSGNEAYPTVRTFAERTSAEAVAPWRPGRPCHHGFLVVPQTGQIVGFVTRYGAACIEA
jgi:hypothetical protein